jgi:osomolarity two-component system response regulator SSK1
MQALIDFDGWRKWKDFADKSENMEGKAKMSASFQGVAKKTNTSLSPTMAANSPDGSGMSVNGAASSSKKDEEKKSKRKSLAVTPPPPLPEQNETGTPDAEASGS